MTCPLCGKDGAKPGGHCDECERLRLDALQDKENQTARRKRNEEEDRSTMYKKSALSDRGRKP